MEPNQLTKEQIGELRDGTISTLIDWGPKICPDIETAIRETDGMLQIRSSFIDPNPSEGFRPFMGTDGSAVRAKLETSCKERFGVKLRTDRATVGEYIGQLGRKNRTASEWFGDLPAWDGIPRLRRFGELFGAESSVYAGGHSPSENADVCELAGRALFMHPCYHSMGVITPAPVVVFVDCPVFDLRRLMNPIVRGPMREVHTPVSTPQKFVEAFDPFTSHILLPGMSQVIDAPYMADVTRFAGIVRDSSVHYRPPYGAQAITVALPMMVGSIPSDNWRRLGIGGTPILPLTVSDVFPDPETVAQCYAEAMVYAKQGHPIVKGGLEGVRTVWNDKKGARL